MNIDDRINVKKQMLHGLLVIVISICGASTCAYLWYMDVFVNKSSAEGLVKAGFISERQKTVKRKFGDNMIWDSINKDENLYWNDSIQTGAHSQVHITLSDGNKILLGESSLVVLERENNKLSLNLKSGQLVVDSQKNSGNKTAEIKINGTTLAKKSNESVSLQMDEAKGEVRAITSAADGSGKQITIDKQGHVEEKVIPATLEAPAQLSQLYTDGAQLNVGFKWQTKQTMKQVIEVSKDKLFKAINATHEAKGNEDSLILQPGVYYWRIRGQGQKDDLVSEVRSFEVIQTKAPEKLLPIPKTKITYRTELPIIDFSWSGTASAEKYIFELSRSEDFKDSILKEETTNTVLRTSKFVDGTLFWRVTSVFGLINKSSAAQSLEVKKILEINPPLLLFPENEFKVTFDFFQQTKGIPFRWKPEANETNRFVLSRSGDLTDLVSAFETTQSETLITEILKSGTYYWAVGHKDSKGDWKYADPRKLIVGPLVPILPAPSLLAGGGKTEYDLIKDPYLKWEWAKVEGAKEYKFRLLKTDSTNKEQVVLDDTLSGLEKNKKDLEDGTYKWAVSSIDTYGRESKPAEHKFSVFHGKTLDAPAIDMPEVQ